MYQAGEFIIYGNTGVCEVTSVGTPLVKGMDADLLYYELRPLYQSGIIYTPVNTKVFMRHTISKAEAQRLIDEIPSLHTAAQQKRSTQELVHYYQNVLQSHDCGDLLALTMSIYAKKQTAEQQKRKFGQVDDRFMRRAEELLYGEFSVSLGIPKEDVPAYIAQRVEARKAAEA